MTPHALLLATRSPGKLRELRPLFIAHGWPVIDLDEAGLAVGPAEDTLEVYSTFEENARIKAVAAAKASGLPALSDDSGIVVDAPRADGSRISRRLGEAGLYPAELTAHHQSCAVT